MEHRCFVYILTNCHHTALYVGVTNDLVRRVREHRTETTPNHNQYITSTNWGNFQETSDVVAAIAREKEIKGGSREKKITRVNAMNPDWRDPFDDLISFLAAPRPMCTMMGDCFRLFSSQ